jgi:hypothetical protein
LVSSPRRRRRNRALANSLSLYLLSIPFPTFPTCSLPHTYPSSAATMQTRRDAAISKGAGSSQGGTSLVVTETGSKPVRISVPTVYEREQQDITPNVSFHTMMQDMQQRMDSMATAIGTLNVELNNSRQASQYPSSWSQARKSSPSR